MSYRSLANAFGARGGSRVKQKKRGYARDVRHEQVSSDLTHEAVVGYIWVAILNWRGQNMVHVERRYGLDGEESFESAEKAEMWLFENASEIPAKYLSKERLVGIKEFIGYAYRWRCILYASQIKQARLALFRLDDVERHPEHQQWLRGRTLPAQECNADARAIMNIMESALTGEEREVVFMVADNCLLDEIATHIGCDANLARMKRTHALGVVRKKLKQNGDRTPASKE